MLVLAAAAVYPALIWNSGAVAYDAAHVHIYRALIFSNALDDGVLYPRWAQFFHYGLGSPVFTFYSPLPYYALALLDRLGLAYPLGWRVLIGGGLLAACLGAYLLVYEITRERWAAVVAGVAYLYAPYVLRNALERGSTEAFCVFLYPWVLWSLLWLARRPTPWRFLAATALWAAAIATHVLGPLMLAPVAGLLALGLAWRCRTAAPLLALLAGGLLTAAIWAPLLQERAYVHAERGFDAAAVQPAANPLPLDRLLAPPAIYDTQRETNDTGDRVGLLQTILLALGVPAAAYAWRRGRRSLALWLGGAAVLGLGLFWSFTSSADWAWRFAAPALGYLQFRTRLMGLEALAAAVVAGCCLALLPRRGRVVVALGLAALLVLAAAPALYINLRHRYAPIGARVTPAEVRAAEFTLEDSALTAFGETVPRWRDQALDARIADDPGPAFDPQAAPLAGAPPGLQVSDVRVGAGRWDLAFTAERPLVATLHLLYYPRWRAQVDGRAVPLQPQPGTGYARVALPAGSHHLALRYAATWPEAAGLAVGGLAALALAALLLWPRAGRILGDKHASRRSLTPVVGGCHRGLGSASSQPDPDHGRLAAPAAAGRAAGPPAWLLLGLTGLVLFKAGYVDRATTWLRCVSTAAYVCGARHAVSVPWTGDIRLRGYSMPDEVAQRGRDLRVELFWQADRQIAKGQYSFLRLRNAAAGQPLNPATGSAIWAEVRHEGPGGFFTTGYLPGRLYADEYRLSVPAGLPPGKYALELGWYDVATGDPLPLAATDLPEPLRAGTASLILGTITLP